MRAPLRLSLSSETMAATSKLVNVFCKVLPFFGDKYGFRVF